MQFESLGQLGDWLDGRQTPTAYVVDPPMTLMEAIDSKAVWASQPSVRKVVDFIARNLASIPINQFQRLSDTERRRITTGPVAELLRKPSQAPLMTPYRFWHGILVDRLIYDRWCALRTSENGREWLDRIPARRFHFATDALDRIEAVVVYGKDGSRMELDPARCVFDAGYSTRGGNGTSPMETLKDILNESTEAVQYRRDVLARGARIPGYIHRPTPWSSKEARERFAAGWRAFSASGGRAGETPVLEDGMEYRALDAFKPNDLELMEGRTLTDVEVASAYHIAPELVGAREGTYSNIDAFRQMLYGPNLGPYIDEWQQVLNAAFADGDTYLEANVDVKLRGSFLEQAQVTSTATGAPWMTRNEARAMRNLPPIAGGDDIVTPLNVLTGGQASPRDTGSQNLGPKSGTKAGPVLVKAEATAGHVTQIERVLNAFFDRQGRSVLSAIGAGEDWWDAKRWDDELATDLLAVSHSIADILGKAAAEALGFDPDSYDPDMTVNFLAAVAQQRAEGINQTTREQLDVALMSEDGDPEQVFETARNSRVGAVAKAVATFAAGFATVEAAKQLRDAEGITPTKTWQTGSNPRAAHARMDGETVAIDVPFSNGMDWPGQGGDEDAGCNCTVAIQA